MAPNDDDYLSFGDFSSELSDPPSTDDEVPLAKSSGKAKGKGKAVGTGYQIKDALRPPRTAQYTAKSLYDQIIDNTIDLDPEYQRGVVWSEQKQSGIIDSILRNYYIPPVIFAVSSSDDGSELRTCIDGKQRLTSIQRFMDGLIPHKDSITSQKFWFKQVGHAKRKLLPKQYMQQFSYKQITCVEYETLSEDQEREIFQRVQLGVALTPAERMQAITGPWPSFIRDIQQEMLGEYGFDGHLDWGHARGRDFQCVTSIVYLADKHKAAFPGAQQLEKWLQENDPVPAKFRIEIFDTFRVFGELVQKFHNTFHRPTKVAPVEFVMIGLLIYTYRMKLSLTQLNSAIEKMRADVRAKFEDIRQNTKVTKAMREFINKKVKASDLKSDKQGDKPASSKARLTQMSTASKRKRAVYSDGDSSESETFKPPPPKSSTIRAGAGSSKAPPASSSLSNIPTKPKTPAKQPSVTKPVPKSTMPTSSVSAGPSNPSIRPPTSTPRIPKVQNDASRNTSPHTMAPPSAQRKQSIPPRPPSAPPSQQSIKLELPMPPIPSDRQGTVRAAGGTSMQSSVIPEGSQSVQYPRRPPPLIQTNFDSASQPSQLSPWSQSPVPPPFPSGTPLAQNNIHELLARAGLAPQQTQAPSGQHSQNGAGPGVQQSLNGTLSGQQHPSGTPPVASQVPAFVQNLNNPLHSQLPMDNLQNGYDGATSFAQGSNLAIPKLLPQAPQAMRNNAVNGTGTAVPSHTTHPLPPRPNSAASAPHPHTSLSSTGSASWYGSQGGQTRPPHEGGRGDRSRDPRDSRGRGSRGYAGRYRDRGRSRSRERDGGWGSRGRASRSPTHSRFGER